jgi:hypothetical protein
MVHDFRQSLRYLRREPTSAVAAVCTVALAIGANTAVFSVVDKVLVQPLPIGRADRIMVIWLRERANPTTIGEISYATFQMWQEGCRASRAWRRQGRRTGVSFCGKASPRRFPLPPSRVHSSRCWARRRRRAGHSSLRMTSGGNRVTLS